MLFNVLFMQFDYITVFIKNCYCVIGSFKISVLGDQPLSFFFCVKVSKISKGLCRDDTDLFFFIWILNLFCI